MEMPLGGARGHCSSPVCRKVTFSRPLWAVGSSSWALGGHAAHLPPAQEDAGPQRGTVIKSKMAFWAFLHARCSAGCFFSLHRSQVVGAILSLIVLMGRQRPTESSQVGIGTQAVYPRASEDSGCGAGHSHPSLMQSPEFGGRSCQQVPRDMCHTGFCGSIPSE